MESQLVHSKCIVPHVVRQRDFLGCSSMAERTAVNRYVEGSSPSISAITIKNIAQSVERVKIYCKVQIFIYLGWQWFVKNKPISSM